MDTGEKIKAARKRKGLSQRALAKRSGVSLTVLNRFENGKASPNLRTLQKLRDALGLSDEQPDAVTESPMGDGEDRPIPALSPDEAALVLAHELEGIVQMLRDPAIGHEAKRSTLNAFIVRYIRGSEWNVTEGSNGLIEKRSRKL